MTLLHRHRNILIFLLLSVLMHGAGLLVLHRSKTTSWSEDEVTPVIRVEMVRITENSPDEAATAAPSAPSRAKRTAAPAYSDPGKTVSESPPPAPSSAEENPPRTGPEVKPPADLPENPPDRSTPPPLPDSPATKLQPDRVAADGAPAAAKVEPPPGRTSPPPLPESEEAVRVAKPLPGTTPAPVSRPKDVSAKEPVEVAEPEPAAATPASAAQPRAPALSSAQQRELLADYQRRVRALIARQKRYPLMARRRQLEGEVLVGFAINPDGSLADSAVVRSSGAPLLDRAALEAVRNAGRFPPPPPFNSDNRRLPVEVPIDFRLR
jgi:protein TonB